MVFLGAGIGGAARHGLTLAAARLLGVAFPYGTLAVNVLGCFLMGVAAGWWTLKGGLSQPVRLFLTTGVFGGVTTFSAFSLDVALLWERGQAGTAALYATASVVLSVGALLLGLALVRAALAGAAT